MLTVTLVLMEILKLVQKHTQEQRLVTLLIHLQKLIQAREII